MRKIRQSGSEGGAVMNRPYPYLHGTTNMARIAAIKQCFRLETGVLYFLD
jgi:hypothetical protein